ncbi:MAG TPA: hypothetical protein V6D22_21735 [Candidatus Obscuribacterales bacterium]
MPISFMKTKIMLLLTAIPLLSCVLPAMAAPDSAAPNPTQSQHHTFTGLSTGSSSSPAFMSAPRLSAQEELDLVTPKNPQAAAEHNKLVTMPSYPWSGPPLIKPFKFPQSMYDHLHKHDPDITQRVQPGDFMPPQRRFMLVGRGASFAPQSFNFLQYADSIKHR